MKEEGNPFKIVLERSLDISKVINIPSKTIAKTTSVEIIEDVKPENILPINIVAIVIKNGNLPLQGTKEFVNIAISFSRGELIILAPITPAALQPNPMHIVSACLP